MVSASPAQTGSRAATPVRERLHHLAQRGSQAGKGYFRARRACDLATRGSSTAVFWSSAGGLNRKTTSWSRIFRGPFAHLAVPGECGQGQCAERIETDWFTCSVELEIGEAMGTP